MNFNFLQGSIGRSIRLERDGPDFLEGKLVQIKTDYIVINSPKYGILYVPSQHIKAVSNSTTLNVKTNQYNDSADYWQPLIEEGENFHSLLKGLNSRLIRVNHHGPNVLEGVLVDVGSEHITMIHDLKENVHYPIFHIKSITCMYRTEEEKLKPFPLELKASELNLVNEMQDNQTYTVNQGQNAKQQKQKDKDKVSSEKEAEQDTKKLAENPKKKQ